MKDFFTSAFIIQLITAAIGTLGFAILFKVQIKHLPYAVLCGLFTYAVYYSILFMNGSLFAAAFFATAVTSVFSEICARICHAPATLFLLPGTIPIVPGGDLYYTMRSLLSGDFNGSFASLTDALLIGIGIAGGIVVMSVLVSLLFGKKRHFKHN